jgi:hypothetical protein
MNLIDGIPYLELYFKGYDRSSNPGAVGRLYMTDRIPDPSCNIIDREAYDKMFMFGDMNRSLSLRLCTLMHPDAGWKPSHRFVNGEKWHWSATKYRVSPDWVDRLLRNDGKILELASPTPRDRSLNALGRRFKPIDMTPIAIEGQLPHRFAILHDKDFRSSDSPETELHMADDGSLFVTIQRGGAHKLHKVFAFAQGHVFYDSWYSDVCVGPSFTLKQFYQSIGVECV